MRWARVGFLGLAACGLLLACGRIGFDPTSTTGDASPTPVETGYIAPTGDDGNLGTRDAPWKTWRHAAARLGPGSTLIALDGMYPVASAGALAVRCDADATACEGAPCANGTATAPIVVRADNERRAVLVGDATISQLIQVNTCEYWSLSGLRIDGGDVDDALLEGVSMQILKSEHITVDRMVIRGSNRDREFRTLLQIHSSSDVTISESELYDFHHSAIDARSGSQVTLRRNYMNPRGHVLVLPSGSTCTLLTAAHGLDLRGIRDSFIENNIVEHTCDAISHQVWDDVDTVAEAGDNNRFTGNIVIGSRSGFMLQSQCNTTNPCAEKQIATNNVFKDCVAIGSERGFWFRGGVNSLIESGSVFGSPRNGVLVFRNPVNAAVASTTFIRNTHVESAIDGFRVDATEAGWQVINGNATAPNPFIPNDSNVINPSTAAGGFGQCLVYVPATSPLKGAGFAGADIGANIVNRTREGMPTAEKLWDASGRFPCGATISDYTDDAIGGSLATEACGNVHLRLGFDGGCAVP